MALIKTSENEQTKAKILKALLLSLQNSKSINHTDYLYFNGKSRISKKYPEKLKLKDSFSIIL